MKPKSRPKPRSILDRPALRSRFVPKQDTESCLTFSTTGTYDESTDINTIHKYVLNKLDKDENSVKDLERQIQDIRGSFHDRMRRVDIKYHEGKIKEIQQKIDRLKSGESKASYLSRVNDILEEWNRVKIQEGPYFKFGSEVAKSPNKLSIIRAYLQVASQYVELNLIMKTPMEDNVCPYCHQELEDEEAKIVCYDCGIYRDLMTHDAEYNDRTHINSISSNGYMNIETFMKVLDCFQGKQKVDFPDDLITKFNEYCTFKKKNKALLNYETARPIFKEIGYSGYFDDINLFLWLHPDIRKPLADLSIDEEAILQDYNLFTSKYQEFKGDERESALNSWYVFYILCHRRGIKCEKTDLKMPDTREIRISNDNIARKVFDALDWKFEDTI